MHTAVGKGINATGLLGCCSADLGLEAHGRAAVWEAGGAATRVGLAGNSTTPFPYSHVCLLH
jgi:hypothetical protein